MQFLENLSDRQAADMVRGRIDWKYLLGLDLTEAGFDASVRSEFRSRLVEGHAEQLLLEKMLTLFQQKGWRNRSRTTANRFDPCTGQDPRPQSRAVRLGNDARCAQ
jgi:transposase